MCKKDIKLMSQLSESMLIRLMKAVSCSSDEAMQKVIDKLIEHRKSKIQGEIDLIDKAVQSAKKRIDFGEHVNKRLSEFNKQYPGGWPETVRPTKGELISYVHDKGLLKDDTATNDYWKRKKYYIDPAWFRPVHVMFP